MTVTLKEFAGGAQATTLSSGITNAASSLIVADGSSFPTGSTAPFVIVLARGTASEEKILVTSRSGNNFTLTTRGYDGSTAAIHSTGDAVEHCLDATTIAEANKAAANTTGKITSAGDLLVGTGSEAMKRLAIGAGYKSVQANAGGTDLTYGDSMASLLTTQADLPYASAANTPARLAKGTANQALTMNAGATAPQWSSSLQSLMTASGDIVYASGANTPARLAKGSDGQTLTLASGLPSWATGAGTLALTVRVSNTAAQSISNTTDTALTFDTNVSDTDGYHSTVSNTSRLTVPAGKGGKLHLFQARVEWTANGTGDRYIAWRLNGTTLLAVTNFPPMNSNRTGGTEAALWYTPADADYLEALVYQSSGISLNVNPTFTEARHTLRVLRVG